MSAGQLNLINIGKDPLSFRVLENQLSAPYIGPLRYRVVPTKVKNLCPGFTCHLCCYRIIQVENGKIRALLILIDLSFCSSIVGHSAMDIKMIFADIGYQSHMGAGM